MYSCFVTIKSKLSSFRIFTVYKLWFYDFCVVYDLFSRNPNVTMGGSLSVPEYAIKVADVTKVRTLNAIAKNTL